MISLKKYYLSGIIRIVIFILFVVSSVAKMFPLWQFEKQLVDLGIVDWCYAPYLARLIIACELATGIAVLQRHFLKRIIIPCTILLLAAFCIHLSIQMYQYGATTGNCGCFGQLIPMTPLEAFIKNIITIAMLVYLYLNVEEKPKGQNKFINLALIGISSALLMFMFFPFAPCKKQSTLLPEINIDTAPDQEMTILPKDSTLISNFANELEVMANNEKTTKSTGNNDLSITGKTTPENIVKITNPDSAKTKSSEKTQPQINSRFTPYSLFGNKRVNLNEGKKIVCLFAPGCDHCLNTSKEICTLSRKAGFPEVYILFMDEETHLIPNFLTETGCTFPYQIVDISEFWNLLGRKGNTPGVFFLHNGNIIENFEGTGANKFNANELMKAIQPE